MLKLKNKKMKFVGDIIITDPCYIIRENSKSEIPEPNYQDFIGNDKSGTEAEKWRKYYQAIEKWKSHNDHWSMCECGSNMEILGIKNYLTKSTEYGDWSCTTFRDVPEAMKLLSELNKNYEKLWNTANSKGNKHKKNRAIKDLEEERKKIEKKYDLILGNFCADTGLVSVFLLDEVLKYNSDFDYHLNRPHTTTLIKNFNGDIEITHRNKEVCVVGKGNINFFTSQTGL
jgi:hypothetical protein